ncbi:hypothetical protein CCR75_005971 [Bremia lactucae]|uniref:Uncharacterized protein n=1 Tax=Bremia lactucae TaxID=4779 RepID=A0A976FHA5_BRELC|nr:hypothetical protein CCR75_005971 [Bremia lactucae]
MSDQQHSVATIDAPRRRRHGDAKYLRMLPPGIVLFDPHDLKSSDAEEWGPSLSVERAIDNQKHEEQDGAGIEVNDKKNEETIENLDSSVVKHGRLRALVVEEICTTEKSYVSDICTLNDHYIVALEDKTHRIMEDAQIAVFFNNLRHLVMLNSKLLEDLQEIVQAEDRKSATKACSNAVQSESEGVGAVFCRYAPLFKLYGDYAKDYEEVAALLQNFRRDTRLGFSQFLESCRQKSGSSKPFESLLIMPIQRIPRYKLLLERLCDLTPPDHPDAEFLTEAVSRVRSVASGINETVRRQENLETVLQAQQKFAGQLSLFTADRRLLKSAKMIKMSTKRQEEVMIHLFNDILLYSDVLISGGYRVRRIVHLRSKAVGVKTELPAPIQALYDQQSRRRVRKDCGFVVTSREKTFILFTDTPKSQREWVDAISSAVTEAQKQKNTGCRDDKNGEGVNVESCEGPADAAALWVPDEVAGSCTNCKASFRSYYRRKHHCRRCGAVVCDTCSSGRAPLYVGESSRAERVCNPCYKVLDLVRHIAVRWLSRVVEFRGVLRRRRCNKWTEHFYELRAGFLKQFALETGSASVTLSDQNGNAAGFHNSGNSGVAGITGSNISRCCTDELNLAGAIVIHRSDSRMHKNRFCFQISTSEYDEADHKVKIGTNQHKALRNQKRNNHVAVRPHKTNFSPLKQAVSRFGDAVSRRRESVIPSGGPSIVSDQMNLLISPSPAQIAPSLSPNASNTNGVATNHETEWILCALTIQEEVAWRVAIQGSADKALHRMRRSRVTDFPGSLAQSGILSLNLNLPPNNIRSSMSVVSSLGCNGTFGRRRMSSIDRGRSTDIELPLELAQTSGEDREAFLFERRRRQILKEIIRSEESYVQCLGDCIRLFVQPLLLRQLEGRQLYRRRQKKRRGSLRPVLGGGSMSAPSRGIISSRGRRRAGSGSNIGTASAASSASSLSSASVPSAPKMLVMDADLSIFFNSVDQIYTLNQQLLDHLSRHVKDISATSLQTENGERVHKNCESTEFSGVQVHRAGAIFHAYAPLMQLYTSYASRHSAALTALDSPQFAGFLSELPHEADVNRLRRYLNMPVERIPRYKLLLQELLESTPPEHIDFVPLQSAIHSVNRVASKIEDISERRENARIVAAVSAKVGIDLTGRYFVRDGLLRKVCRSKVHTYYFVLLEDAMVYGRQGGIYKKKFRLIDLWECKVAEDTETMPGFMTTVVSSNNAFCFYSPLKSFILLTESKEDKNRWTSDICDCIDRNLRGKTHPRRPSVRTELLTDNEDDSSSGYELEGGFVIKNGWLNVTEGAVESINGGSGTYASPSPTTNSSISKKSRRLWITLTLQTVSMGSTFKAAQPEETIPIELCEVASQNNEKCFRLQLLRDTKIRFHAAYVFEALSLVEREEWVRALTLCITGGDELDLRRRSLKTATLAPIFMFDKVSNVCTICSHSFAVYRPRHHCRLCGSLVCGNCSKRRWTLSYSSSKKASRVCDSCALSTMSITRSFATDD